MQTVTLGRTGLAVSVVGLGCGGRSRLGQRRGASEEQSIAIVREALDLGVNFVDTASSYGTEGIVGRAIKGRREGVVVSTKAQVRDADGGLLDVATLRKTVEESLSRLQTSMIDVFHLHAVRAEDYRYCVSELVPALMDMRERGEIRFIALSEFFGGDFGHEMFPLTAGDDCWDVAMVGFNMLNPSARTRVLPAFIAKDIGVEVMFAVRTMFSNPAVLRQAVADAVSQGLIDGAAIDLGDPLGFLVHENGASSIVDAAYRFARHEPGCHVVLTGTGNLAHLQSNIESINKPPLPAEDLSRLAALFGHLAHFAGN
jgi:L-galactose dehydrogenase